MATLTLDQIQRYITFGQLAITLGIHTWTALQAIFRQAGLTEQELNQILDALAADAEVRRARSAQIAAGADPDALDQEDR